MVLLATVPGAIVTQPFGPSAIEKEPTLWVAGERAAWSPFRGSTPFVNFHPGVDRAKAAGSPVEAMEAGHVVFAGWNPDGVSGIQVNVEIRPGTRFSANHLQSVAVKVGDVVTRGQLIGRVGQTGYATGPHVHEGLSFVEPDPDGIYRTFQYDPQDFLAGGKHAHDPRIKPEVRQCRVIAPAVIWFAGRGYDEASDIFAYARNAHGSREPGIYRRGVRRAGLGYRFTFVRWRDTATVGRVAIVTGFRRRLGIRDQDMQFV